MWKVLFGDWDRAARSSLAHRHSMVEACCSMRSMPHHQMFGIIGSGLKYATAYHSTVILAP